MDNISKLYHSVNLMMAELGAKGEIDTRNQYVEKVMDALYDIDGGVYDQTRNMGANQITNARISKRNPG